MIAATLQPHPAMILPFALLLFCIAAMPFVHRHWWESHYPKIAVGLGLITAGYYVFALHHPERMAHVALEYVSFIALIGSLFVVSGGIHIQVKGEATPRVNVLFLAIGGVLASIIGTTGASMLLIRPWIRMNRYRITAFHIVFFIFIVSNVGGGLTPIGDPPLFLGFLKGVPFGWVIEHCWPAWLITMGLLLAVFHVLDRRNFRRAPQTVRDQETAHESWKFDGLHNLLFLGVILGGVFCPTPWREILMIAAALGSYFSTRRHVHRINDFSFLPIQEVAWLFAGIFATMVPALDLLETHAASLGVSQPMQFYWFSGILSGLLDNAPTYLTFLAAAFGLQGLSLDNPAHMETFLATRTHDLIAISLGSVFFGAITYIGNGPNFMVKSIADRAQVETPGFVGYFLKFALPILLPIYFLIGLLFFSRFHLF
ncbi:MAG: sodium:proton antiporter [Chthoniobacterales bacterium]